MHLRVICRLALACLLVAGMPVIGVAQGGSGKPASGKPASGKAPLPAVVVAPVRMQGVAPAYTFIGHVQAIKSVQLMARVTAFLDQIDFQEGSHVKQGQVLFQLEKAPFKAAVQAAQAQLDKAQAQYAQARVAFQRAEKLNKQGFAAQAKLDQARATRDSAAADVEAAKANLAQAAINLSYTTIVSPIDGLIGASTYDVGNLVTPSSKPLATVNQMDPIRVAFAVADRDMVSVQQRTKSGPEQIAQKLTVSLQLPDGSAYQQRGKITFINNQVDPATGTVTVWANFANPRHLLLPGAYVTAEVRRTAPQRKPTVPVAAVQSDQKGSYVLLVGPNDKVQQQQIKLGRQIGQSYIVQQGLSGGERVVVQGVQKVRPGETVKPVAAGATGQLATQGGSTATQGGSTAAQGG